MNRRLFKPRKTFARKLVTWLFSIAALIIVFGAGATLLGWFNNDESPQAQTPALALGNENETPVLLARQEATSAADAESGLAPVKPMPLNQPMAVAPDGTSAFFFCFEGNLPESRLLVVDKSRQRLMVLRYMGEMVLEYEYPCATGANEGGKQVEGDARTPVGIYFTTHRYIDNKISMFGDRAIHLDYPNAFDMDQSRNGNGIFMHGTNQVLKPRTSNGCINMRNEDIALVGELIKDQVTPVIIVESLSLPELNQRIKACEWFSHIDVDEMAARPARMGQGLGLLNPPPGFHYSNQPGLDAIGEKLWGFTQPAGKAILNTTGMSIFGLGNQWVLVANQKMKVNNREYDITRRLYLEGSDPRNASLLRTSWVVKDKAEARALAALAPKVTPPIVLAAAEPQTLAADASAGNLQSAPTASAVSVQPMPEAPSTGASPAVAPSAGRQPAPEIPATGAQPTAVAEGAGAQPTAAPALPSVGLTINPEEQLRQLLTAWLKAWSGKNLNSYMAFYAPEFVSDKNQDIKAWRSHKQYLFRTYNTIAVKAGEVKIKVLSADRAEITFKQNYRSDWHQDTGYKTLNLRLGDNGAWLITAESWRQAQ